MKTYTAVLVALFVCSGWMTECNPEDQVPVEVELGDMGGGFDCQEYDSERANLAYYVAWDCADGLGLLTGIPRQQIHICIVEEPFVCPGLDWLVAECATGNHIVIVSETWSEGYDFEAHVVLGIINSMIVFWDIDLPLPEDRLREDQRYFDLIECATGGVS